MYVFMLCSCTDVYMYMYIFILSPSPLYTLSQQYGWFSPGDSGFHPKNAFVLPCDPHHLTSCRPDRPATFILLLYFCFSSLFLPVCQSGALHPPLVNTPTFLNKSLKSLKSLSHSNISIHKEEKRMQHST